MRSLPSVTLFGLDGVDIDRLLLASTICKKDFDFGAVKLLTHLPSSHPDVVAVPPVLSIRAYSEFMLKKMATFVDTEHVLIVQHDGFILNPNAWLPEFLEYDYIGAPFYTDGVLKTGNGGFCLRSKRLVDFLMNDPRIQMLAEPAHAHDDNEDWLICTLYRDIIEQAGFRFAPPEIAHRFSLEANEFYGNKWTDEFGFHGLRWTDISSWLLAHPEYTIDNTLSE